ncbi:MAG: hydroxymethylbilane synthase [Sedimentisphaerales bacterium]|nr:hydroxymethylbilane synthase [Sedimentisphaerales bacterium]
MKILTVATRGGALAIAQTKIVNAGLQRIYPDLKIEIKTVATRGDRDRRTALWDLKDSGFFTSQVEDALLAGEADLAVHSFKDLPTRLREGLTIAAVCDRAFPEDCLVSPNPISAIEQLGNSAKIGTSSLRRAVQIRRLRKDLEPVPIRGNVQTRIRKLDKGEFDAVILARAGLERLALGDKISFCFDPRNFIPAPAQGALAVQTRETDIEIGKVVAAIDDEKVRMVTCAERQVLATMQCGCHAPVGAFANIVGDNIEICAFISDLQGENLVRREIVGPASKGQALAEQLAQELLQDGGREILAKLGT